jgi:hypothetical protein
LGSPFALLGRLRVEALVAEELEAEPFSSFVPLLVTTLIVPPFERPVSARKRWVSKLNSPIESSGKSWTQPADRVVVVVAAVDQVVDVAAAAAVDLGRELRRLRGVGVEAEAHSGASAGQVAELAAVQRQVLDLGAGDDLAHSE